MSAPITEAHLRLANQLVASPPSPLVIATLIADSEAEAVQIAMIREYGNLSATNESLAKERDQLRAEVERLKTERYKYTYDPEMVFTDDLGWLQSVKAEFDEITARAKRAEAELTFQQERNSRLFEQRDAAVEAQDKAEAELATEREKLSTLREACGHISYIPRIQSALDKTAPAPGALT